MSRRPWRVGVCGFALESNRFAPPTTAQDFADGLVAEGHALAQWLRHSNGDAFCDAFDDLAGASGWTLVPLAVAAAGPGGPCEDEVFRAYLVRLEQLLDAALRVGPLDALYVIGHGAATTTVDDDPDGTLLTRLRDRMGADRPIVVLNDFHANPSDRLLRDATLALGYRHNPHTDILDRSRDAARLTWRLLQGWRPHRHWQRVPMLVPQVMQLTATPAPMAVLFAQLDAVLAQTGIASASVWPGFSLADVPHAGLVVHVAGDDAARVRAAVDELARTAWALRERVRPRLHSIDAAVAAAQKHAAVQPLVLADVADNPGGGGRGCTRWLIDALRRAGVADVVAGLHWSPRTVAQAAAAGAGATIDMCLDDDGDTAGPVIRARAEVRSVHDGVFRSSVGMCAGQTLRLGPTVVLGFDGISLVCNSVRQQILGADAFEALGLEPRHARVLVLKSRGHFRAGFSHVVDPVDIVEVDAPGLTSPIFRRFRFTRLPRGLHPFEPDIDWSPGR